MSQDFIQIGYMDSRFDKSMKVLTAEVLDQLTSSDRVYQTMAQIEATADQEEKKLLKEQLPVVLYACQMTEEGVRPKKENGLGVASGFCLHDWDHMQVDPRAFYLRRIAGREKELRIVLAHVTPRGEGLRLVTEMGQGESIAQCQARLAREFGMEQYADRQVKDITRLSFLPSKDYVLFVDAKGLFEKERKGIASPTPVKAVPEVSVMPAPQDEAVIEDEEIFAPVCEPETHGTELQKPAENSIYNGVKYSQIIEALMKRLATQGEVREGERNNVLFKMVRELRHIVGYNFQTTYLFLKPYFADLPDAEVRSTIGSAIATNGRTVTPMLQGVLNELKNENADAADEQGGQPLPRLPKLSDVEEMIVSHYPKHLRGQVFLSMLPIWGVYGTKVRFDYLDGRVNSLSFMTAVVGKSGSGKAFAAHLFEQMTPTIREQDRREREKADQYLAMCNKASDDSEKPDDPRPRVRIYGDDITTSQLLEYLDNLKGQHGLQFTEEVARLQKAKRTIYGDNDDLYCKAFDNAVGGKESKNKQTRNIRINIYLNTLFCGTPGAMHKFYNNPEGGLNNRILYAFMPKVRSKGFPNYRELNDEERAQFDDVCNRLAQVDGTKVSLPWLDKVIVNLKNRWDREDDENPNEVWYDLGKRSLVVAMRVGVLQWYLRGCPEDEKQQREIGRVVQWTAEAMRQSVYMFSGKDYEAINDTDNAYQQQQVSMTKNRKLFSLLPNEFTTQELISLRMQNGGNANVATVIWRWKSDGLIRKVGSGRYSKVG